MPAARPDLAYLDLLIAAALEYGFPAWYLDRLDSARAKQG
jgi:hypothetical protein